METKLQRGGGHPVNSTNPKGTYFMKVLKLLCVASTLAIPATASATTISFDLASSGYVQDSPVAPDLFAGSGLMLSSDIVTACAGECISTPAGTYTGTLSGDFMGSAYTSLEFVGVNGHATIDLYDSAHALVATLNPTGTVFVPTFEGGSTLQTYTYAGSTGIASFSAALGYDGLEALTFDSPTAAPVPEPASMLLLGTGVLGAGLRRWRKHQA